jgi:hypothetical protein
MCKNNSNKLITFYMLFSSLLIDNVVSSLYLKIGCCLLLPRSKMRLTSPNLIAYLTMKLNISTTKMNN